MKAYGYGGKILRVDLSRKESRADKVDRSWIKTVIGGKAANIRRIADESELPSAPLASENLIAVGVGPLTGSWAPSSSSCVLSACSPLNGNLGHAVFQGHFGAEMKLTGFDQIIIKGVAKKPTYLLISEAGATFCDARKLAGMTPFDAAAAIRREHRDPAIQTLAIGPAGENRVLFAGVISGEGYFSDNSGLGAAMGAKNLKAVAVRGDLSVRFADIASFSHLCRDMRLRIAESRNPFNSGANPNTGNAPGFSKQLFSPPPTQAHSGKETDFQKMRLKKIGCFNCNFPCSGYYVGVESEGEITNAGLLGGMMDAMGNSGPAPALELYLLMLRQGLEPRETIALLEWIGKRRQTGRPLPPGIADCGFPGGDYVNLRDWLMRIAQHHHSVEPLTEGLNRLCRKVDDDFPGTNRREGGKEPQLMELLADSLGICRKTAVLPGVLDYLHASALLQTGAGMDFSPEYLDKILADSLERESRFNLQYGMRIAF